MKKYRVMALTDKKVNIRYSSQGASASETASNGDIIFDSANKKIYARGQEWICTGGGSDSGSGSGSSSSVFDGYSFDSLTMSFNDNLFIWTRHNKTTQNVLAFLCMKAGDIKITVKAGFSISNSSIYYYKANQYMSNISFGSVGTQFLSNTSTDNSVTVSMNVGEYLYVFRIGGDLSTSIFASSTGIVFENGANEGVFQCFGNPMLSLRYDTVIPYRAWTAADSSVNDTNINSYCYLFDNLNIVSNPRIPQNASPYRNLFLNCRYLKSVVISDFVSIASRGLVTFDGAEFGMYNNPTKYLKVPNTIFKDASFNQRYEDAILTDTGTSDIDNWEAFEVIPYIVRR